MARPRTFDPDDVLDTARDLFWSKGYQGTSLDDITAATGLTKPSLYAAFGDKASLFARVLDRYHERLLAHARRTLGGDAPARAALEAWLTGFVAACSGAKGGRGCLSVNTTLDGSVDSAVVKKSIARFNAAIEALIVKRLDDARAEFGAGFDPVAAAHTIVTVYTGLMATAKQAPRPERVRAVIAQTMKILT